jgi:hypothetical protein
MLSPPTNCNQRAGASQAPTIPTTTPSSSSNPDYFSNPKYEEIICQPIKPLYDGMPDNLIPFFLNRLDIHCQDEGWGSIAYINIGNTKNDLLKHFAKIDKTVILEEAHFHWLASTVDKDKHQLQHPTFHSRLLESSSYEHSQMISV